MITLAGGRPADSRCAHPEAEALPDAYRTGHHKLGYYLSTYCEHGLGEGRAAPSLCRVWCKISEGLGTEAALEPCACLCHEGRIPPFDGFDMSQEKKLRDACRRVVRELGVAPRGPRGDELIADIVTGMLHQLDHDEA